MRALHDDDVLMQQLLGPLTAASSVVETLHLRIVQETFNAACVALRLLGHWHAAGVGMRTPAVRTMLTQQGAR